MSTIDKYYNKCIHQYFDKKIKKLNNYLLYPLLDTFNYYTDNFASEYYDYKLDKKDVRLMNEITLTKYRFSQLYNILSDEDDYTEEFVEIMQEYKIKIKKFKEIVLHNENSRCINKIIHLLDSFTYEFNELQLSDRYMDFLKLVKTLLIFCLNYTLKKDIQLLKAKPRIKVITATEEKENSEEKFFDIIAKEESEILSKSSNFHIFYDFLFKTINDYCCLYDLNILEIYEDIKNDVLNYASKIKS